MKQSGIYVIINIKNGKVYIGKTKNLKRRWVEHQRELNKNHHHNQHLQAAWNKYGAKAFQFKILEHCSIDQLNEREKNHIPFYRARGLAYNLKDGGEGGANPSEETRRKLSAAGRNRSEATLRRMSEIHKGISPSEETRRKLSQALKGRTTSEETRHKLSAANKGKRRNVGREINEITKKKIAEANAKYFIVTSPEGIEFTIKGLNRFCRENNLSPSNMSKIANGKQSLHKGWTCRKFA